MKEENDAVVKRLKVEDVINAVCVFDVHKERHTKTKNRVCDVISKHQKDSTC